MEISKQQVIDEIRMIGATAASGILTITTDQQHSVVLQFADGRLCRAIARGTGVARAARALAESERFSFRFSPGSVEGGRELAPIEDFIALIEEGPDTPAPAMSASPAEADADPDQRRIHDVLAETAARYIGPMADLVVTQAMQHHGSVQSVIHAVAASIPSDPDGFSEQARRRLGL